MTDGIRLIQKEDLTLLDAAVLPEAIENMLIAKREKLILMSQRLLEIDKHDALFLLKNCYSIPKLTYVLRTVPCFTRPDILQTYDLIIKEALENILNTSLKQDSCWIQSTLPVNLGGFGNRLASEIALPAYLSSVRASIGTTSSLLTPEIQQDRNAFYEKGCQEWISKLEVTELPDKPMFQSNWDKPLCQKKLERLLDDTPNYTEKSRILACSSEAASAFLNALPLANCGLRLSDTEFPIIC